MLRLRPTMLACLAVAAIAAVHVRPSAAACTPDPEEDCRQPIKAGKAGITLKDKSPDTGDTLVWKWTAGQTTPKSDFGDPTTTEDYALCLYQNGALVKGWSIPAGGLCKNNKPCWKSLTSGYSYNDALLTPDGIQAAKLTQGLVDGKAKVSVKGKGAALAMPSLASLTGVLDIQLQTATGPCFGAKFSPPFKKSDGTQLVAVSDATTTTTTTSSTTTTTTLAPTWAAIQAAVIGPRCGGCHGGSGGLQSLGNCTTAYNNLVNVAAVELPTMMRVAPGDPANSWLMHKLDGDQSSFTAQCTGNLCGDGMPPSGTLSQSIRDSIRAWITNGAVNDCP